MPDYLLHAVAGGFSGMAVDSVLFPLDTIKTRLQARAGTDAATVARARGPASFYRGALRRTRHLGVLVGSSLLDIAYAGWQGEVTTRHNTIMVARARRPAPRQCGRAAAAAPCTQQTKQVTK